MKNNPEDNERISIIKEEFKETEETDATPTSSN